MRVCTIYWSPEKDLTTYKFSKEFEQSHFVDKLDALKDAIDDLQEKYKEIFIENYEELR
jgi:hypothetical protein